MIMVAHRNDGVSNRNAVLLSLFIVFTILCPLQCHFFQGKVAGTQLVSSFRQLSPGGGFTIVLRVDIVPYYCHRSFHDSESQLR